MYEYTQLYSVRQLPTSSLDICTSEGILLKVGFFLVGIFAGLHRKVINYCWEAGLRIEANSKNGLPPQAKIWKENCIVHVP